MTKVTPIYDSKFTANSRVKRVLYVSWKLSKTKWLQLLERNSKSCIPPYWRIEFGKNQVNIVVERKQVIDVIKWIMKQHKKFKIPYVLKTGESRFFFPTLGVLSKKDIKKYKLAKTELGIIFQKALDFVPPPPVIPMEELDFNQILTELKQRLEVFNTNSNKELGF